MRLWPLVLILVSLEFRNNSGNVYEVAEKTDWGVRSTLDIDAIIPQGRGPDWITEHYSILLLLPPTPPKFEEVTILSWALSHLLDAFPTPWWATPLTCMHRPPLWYRGRFVLFSCVGAFYFFVLLVSASIFLFVITYVNNEHISLPLMITMVRKGTKRVLVIIAAVFLLFCILNLFLIIYVVLNSEGKKTLKKKEGAARWLSR